MLILENCVTIFRLENIFQLMKHSLFLYYQRIVDIITYFLRHTQKLNIIHLCSILRSGVTRIIDVFLSGSDSQ